MTVLSGIFQKLSEKISDPAQADFLLKSGIEADPTQAANVRRKADAAQMTDKTAAAAMLLEGLKDEAQHVGKILKRMGVPLSIQSDFNAAASDSPPEAQIGLWRKGERLLSFKASPTEDGYYLKIEENMGGDEFSLDMMQNFPVKTFAEVEKNLSKHLETAFNVPKQIANHVLWNMTNSL